LNERVHLRGHSAAEPQVKIRNSRACNKKEYRQKSWRAANKFENSTTKIKRGLSAASKIPDSKFQTRNPCAPPRISGMAVQRGGAAMRNSRFQIQEEIFAK
jgi:hypothetical protein